MAPRVSWCLAALAPSLCRGQCTVPVVENAVGSCAGGATIPSLGSCQPECAEGYVLGGVESSGVLSCVDTFLTPSTFTCTGQDCAPPMGLPWGADIEGLSNCIEGYDRVPHGAICTPRCSTGFSLDTTTVPWDPVLRINYLPCSAGQLTPNTFTCLGSACQIPEAGTLPGQILNAHQWTPCSLDITPKEIPHQGFCDPMCKDGWHPNVSSAIQCFAGNLSTWFECLGNPCEAPLLIQFAEDVTCEEGPSVPHGASCTPKCSDGYRATSEPMPCWAGVLEPPRFGCTALNCSAHHWLPGALLPIPGFETIIGYAGAENVPVVEYTPPQPRTCQEGTSIFDQGICTANCQPGYVPDVAVLDCQLGNFSPPLYHCVGQPCAAPTNVAGAMSPSCEEGLWLDHGGLCTARCQFGFVASVQNLSCNATQLEPPSFECLGLPCSFPEGIEHAADPPCLEALENFTHGTTCTTQCQAGYQATESVLFCHGGQLRPGAFKCLPEATFQEFPDSGAVLAKAWSKEVKAAALQENYALACHKDDFSQSMHCVVLLAGGTLLQAGPRFQASPANVEDFVLAQLAPQTAAACYRVQSDANDMSGATLCRFLEVSGSTVLAGAELQVGDLDTFHLSLARVTDSEAAVCFQRGLSTWACLLLLAGPAAGTELAVPGTLTGLTLAALDGDLLACGAEAAEGRALTCHLLQVSGTSLVLASSLPLSAGAAFLTAASVGSRAAVCYSDWAEKSQAVCKLLQASSGVIEQVWNMTVDAGISRYLTLTPVREDRLLLCFERQGLLPGEVCADEAAQCGSWAEAGECAINPLMDSLCRRSCGICNDVGPSRGQCNVLGLSGTMMEAGLAVVVNAGITWNLAAAQVDNDTAVVCFSDTSVRDAARCRTLWAVRNWEVLEARACGSNASCVP